MSKKKLFTTLLIPGTFLVPFIILFLFKGELAEWKIEKMIYDAGMTQAKVEIKGLNWVGVHDLKMKKMSIQLNEGSSIYLEDVLIQTDNFPGTLSDLKLHSLFVSNVKANYSPGREQGLSTGLPNPADLIRNIVKALNLVSSIHPEQVEIANIEFEKGTLKATVQDLSMQDSVWTGWVSLENGNFSDLYEISGRPNFKNGAIDFVMERSSHKVDRIVKNPNNERFSFDRAEVNTWAMNQGNKQAGLLFLIEGLKISHPLLADSMVLFPEIAGDISLHDRPMGSLIDQGSLLLVGDVAIVPHFSIDSLTGVSFSLIVPEQPAGFWMDAIPEGFFAVVPDLKFSGEAGLMFAMDYQPDDPLSLEVFFQMEDRNLKISSFGTTGMNKLQNTISYHPFGEKGRTRAAGPETKGFIKLDAIPELMQMCLLKAEDPHFFEHHGIDERGLGIAFRENMSTGSFSRGGSTISMQLTRNLFLSQAKTISRKLEEIALTSLIEDKQLASKDQILELYFNVVEWGPGLYGIGEASEFYFNTQPENLKLDQMAFLACILPNPRNFHTMLNEQGNPLEFATDNMNSLKFLLLMEGLVSDEDFDEEIDLDLSPQALALIQNRGSEAQGPHI